MTAPDRQTELREARDRRALKRWAERIKRDEYRRVDEALRKWRQDPPSPVPDAEPEGYKP